MQLLFCIRDKKGFKMLINVKWICQLVMINYTLQLYWHCSTNCHTAFQSVNKKRKEKKIIISPCAGKWTIMIHKKEANQYKKLDEKAKNISIYPSTTVFLFLFLFWKKNFHITHKLSSALFLLGIQKRK